MWLNRIFYKDILSKFVYLKVIKSQRLKKTNIINTQNLKLIFNFPIN